MNSSKDHAAGGPAAGVRGEHARVLWEKLRTSFWLVPGMLSLLAALLAFGAHQVDVWLADVNPENLSPLIFVSRPDTARDIISTLLSSMITMTSLVFSITMVVLTLAASQFGPRLIRSFMSSPHTQYVLGVFVMTSVYCLIVLGTLGTMGTGQRQIFATVSLALLLTLLSLGLLVVFLHFLARSIVSETVIERVGREIDEAVEALDPIPVARNESLEKALPDDFDSAAHFFGPTSDGYIEAIEFDPLVALAERAGVLIGLSFRPGDYVVVDGGGIGVYPAERCNKKLQEEILRAIAIGPHRTPNQDPEFSIRHLVEIAMRALSPGINDPYTATAVVNQLSASLSRLMRRALPQGVMKDEAGVTRLVCPQSTYASLLGVAFNQIRQNASDKPLIVIHMLDAIARIAEHTALEAQRRSLREHLEAITGAAARDIRDDVDKRAVEVRAAAAYAALGQQAGG